MSDCGCHETATQWPDFVIGTLVAVLFMKTATTVLAGAWKDWHRSADERINVDALHGFSARSQFNEIS